MRTTIKYLCGVVLAMSIAMLPVFAVAEPRGGRWVDRTGSWSVDFGGVGWGYATGLPESGGPEMLLAPPSGRDARGTTRLCLAQGRLEDRPASASDDELRARGAQLSADDISNIVPAAEMRDIAVQYTVVDGVAVAAVDARSRANTLRGRAFVLPVGNQMLSTLIFCFWGEDVSTEQIAEMVAILQSLQFTNTTSEPT